MRVTVDLNLCQAYAQCCFLAPNTFKLRGREVLLHLPEPDESQYQDILRAIAACPVQAIAAQFAVPGLGIPDSGA